MQRPALESVAIPGAQVGERERLLLAMADACDAAGPPRSADAAERLSQLFLGLLSTAPEAARARLAARVAHAAWPPRQLAVGLAQDLVDVGAPVIAASAALGETDLLALVGRSPEHAVEVARRPGLPAPVVAAIVDGGDPLALSALAANATAPLSGAELDRLVEAARDASALRGPLARRNDLGPVRAQRLAGWVGPDLRADLVRRHGLDGSAASGEPTSDTDARLVAKLDASGQLRPGFLLRTLREGRLSLFEAALARLGGFARDDVARAVAAEDAAPLALSCAAVGIDRSAWPTLLALVRGLNDGRPAAVDPEGRVALALCCTPQSAARAFHRAMETA